MERLGERDRAPAPARVGGQLLNPFPPAVGAQRGDTWSLRDISSMRQSFSGSVRDNGGLCGRRRKGLQPGTCTRGKAASHQNGGGSPGRRTPSRRQ